MQPESVLGVRRTDSHTCSRSNHEMEAFVYLARLIHCAQDVLHSFITPISIWALVNYSHWPVGLRCNTSSVRGSSSVTSEQRPVLKNAIPAVLRGSVLHQPLALYPNKLALFFLLFQSLTLSRLEEKVFKINMRPPVFRAGTGGSGGLAREKTAHGGINDCICLTVCVSVCAQGSLCSRARKRNRFPFFFLFFFNPSKAAWPFLLYCRRTKRCGVEMSAEWADREKADGVRYWWKKGAARPRPILQLGPLFCLSVFLLLLLRINQAGTFKKKHPSQRKEK